MKNITKFIFVLAFIGFFSLHIFTPLGYFTGKKCDVEFHNGVVIRYLNKDKGVSHSSRVMSRLRVSKFYFADVSVLKEEKNRICFGDYESIKYGEENEYRKVFPTLYYTPEEALLVEREDGSFCVKRNYVQSISTGVFGWMPFSGPD